MRFKLFTILILVLILAISCEEQLSWGLKNESSDLIVVEGVLTNENKQHLIKITRPHAELNQASEPVSGALVKILSGRGNVDAQEIPLGSGLYYTDSIIAITSFQYTLRIEYAGQTYTATAYQPAGEPLEPLQYSKTSNNYYKLEFTGSTSAIANYVEYYLDWEDVEGCEPPSDCRAKLIYYDLKNVDVHEQFKPEMEAIEFPFGTTVVRRKFSVSDEYKEYLRGMLSETYWRGGVFDVFPANAPTNLSDGAIGFFAVSTVVSDTTVIID